MTTHESKSSRSLDAAEMNQESKSSSKRNNTPKQVKVTSFFPKKLTESPADLTQSDFESIEQHQANEITLSSLSSGSESEYESETQDINNEVLPTVSTSRSVKSKKGASGKEKNSQCKKKKIYKQNFVHCWLQLPEFSDWLEKRFNTSQKCYVAYCKVCNEFKTNGKSELQRHCRTPRHQRFKQVLEENADLREKLDFYLNCPTEKQTIILEVKLVLFLIENNLPISLIEDLISLLRVCFPRDVALQQLAMAKQKCGNVIRFGLGKHFKADISKTLRTVFFSVIMDETTDVSVQKQLAVMVEYYNVTKAKTVVELLNLVHCEDGKASTLFMNLIHLFEERDIPLQRLVGFSADTCNTMFGIHQSVTSLLKTKLPQLLAVKCFCHLSHLCASYACKKLPKILETGLKWLFNHFSRSAGRRKTFSEFQKFTDIEPHAILRTADTRWLSLEAAVNRVLEQFPPLKLYFTDAVSECKEDEDCESLQILQMLNDPATKPYLEFMSYALHCINEFNTVFQAESPLLYTLRDRVRDLIRDFANNFMEASYVRETEPLELDPSLEEHYIPVEHVYLGILAEETLKETDLCDGDIQKIRVNCRTFYISAINQFQARFNFDDPYFKFCKLVIPVYARKANPKLIVELFQRFPVIKETVKQSAAEFEWRKHALLNVSVFNADQESDVSGMSVEHYWNVVLNLDSGKRKVIPKSLCRYTVHAINVVQQRFE